MAKQRYINTKFWSDGYVVNLDVIERYLFLYFLTNEHTNIAGIYELPIEVMSRETGLEKDHLERIMPRFAGKIYYFSGWVYVKNFSKHQAINDSVKKGIAASMKDVPANIIEKVKQINEGVPTLPQPATPCIHPATYLNSNLNSNSNLDLKIAAGAAIKKHGGIMEGYKLPKQNSKNVKQWQDEAANAIKIINCPEEKISSVFKCYRDNQHIARLALIDCKELGKCEALYFLKVYNELIKKNKN